MLKVRFVCKFKTAGKVISPSVYGMALLLGGITGSLLLFHCHVYIGEKHREC